MIILVSLAGCIRLSTYHYHRSNQTRAKWCACRASFALRPDWCGPRRELRTASKLVWMGLNRPAPRSIQSQLSVFWSMTNQFILTYQITVHFDKLSNQEWARVNQNSACAYCVTTAGFQKVYKTWITTPASVAWLWLGNRISLHRSIQRVWSVILITQKHSKSVECNFH